MLTLLTRTDLSAAPRDQSPLTLAPILVLPFSVLASTPSEKDRDFCQAKNMEISANFVHLTNHGLSLCCVIKPLIFSHFLLKPWLFLPNCLEICLFCGTHAF